MAAKAKKAAGKSKRPAKAKKPAKRGRMLRGPKGRSGGGDVDLSGIKFVDQTTPAGKTVATGFCVWSTTGVRGRQGPLPANGGTSTFPKVLFNLIMVMAFNSNAARYIISNSFPSTAPGPGYGNPLVITLTNAGFSNPAWTPTQ